MTTAGSECTNSCWGFCRRIFYGSSSRKLENHQKKSLIVKKFVGDFLLLSCVLHSHFNPWRTRPKSISPQKSQKAGDLYECTFSWCGRICTPSWGMLAADEIIEREWIHKIKRSCMRHFQFTRKDNLDECIVGDLRGRVDELQNVGFGIVVTEEVYALVESWYAMIQELKKGWKGFEKINKTC